MKIPQLKFIVLVFSFTILYTLSIKTLELGYNEIELLPGITELSYIIKEPSLKDTKSPFISLLVFEDNINVTLILKEFEESESEYKPIFIPKKQWFSFPLMLFQELYKELHVVLLINNDNSFPAKLIFIDNSKEFNINLEKFLNWKYKISYESLGLYVPTPLTVLHLF